VEGVESEKRGTREIDFRPPTPDSRLRSPIQQRIDVDRDAGEGGHGDDAAAGEGYGVAAVGELAPDGAGQILGVEVRDI
jgi:hypothetical protein